MIFKKMNVKVFVGALAVLSLVACSKNDVFDAEQVAKNKEAQAKAKMEESVKVFQTEFEKHYGKVDPNQSWDFSTGTPTISLPSSSAKAGTRAGGYQRTDSKDYYEFPTATITKMKSVFKEGRKENKNDGTAFGMHVPGNAFTIVPMYMGTSGGNFELWMHVDGIADDILVWKKWQDMQVHSEDWWGNPTEWTSVWNFDNEHNCTYATAIRSKYYTFSGLPKDAVMYFYLKITATADGFNKKGDVLSSVNDYMREYKFKSNELPSDLPGVKNPEVMIIGCEDANTSKSDTDYNDVVFMIYGEPYIPSTFEVTEFETTYSKRYMIEDLGSTDDFDFNDIVVDVQETFKQVKTKDAQGKVTWSNPVLQGQKAILRHRGGILPFELTIGNKNLGKMDGVLSDDPNTEFEVAGWNRDANNISIKVYQSAKSQTATQVNFPQPGAIPMIIATDTNVAWSAERVEFNWKEFIPTPAE